MHFIDAVKNFHSYLFLGRCRRHGRDLSEVHVPGHYASTMPVCIECHPRYRGLEIKTPPSQTAVPEYSEVEVG